jgi:hypothetical protein
MPEKCPVAAPFRVSLAWHQRGELVPGRKLSSSKNFSESGTRGMTMLAGRDGSRQSTKIESVN